MQFIPGSHNWEVKAHHSINQDPRVHGLEIDEDITVDYSQAVASPLPADGCTLHLSRTLHYTGPNKSDIPRRALIMAYNLPTKVREEARVFPWNEIKITPRQQSATQAAQKSKA